MVISGGAGGNPVGDIGTNYHGGGIYVALNSGNTTVDANWTNTSA